MNRSSTSYGHNNSTLILVFSLSLSLTISHRLILNNFTTTSDRKREERKEPKHNS